MQIDEKLKLINDLMERKKNENAIKENEVYKLLLGAIDNTALPKLAEDIKLLADKLQSVEKQAPEYYQRALKQLYGLATEIKNTEVRLSETNAKTEELTKEVASIQLKHGKDGYTPKKGIDYFDGRPGKDGEDGIGIDGVGIETAEIKGLNLVITLTNGEEIDVGKVVGRDGWSASGKSAYQYAKESGYTGTEAEFSEALSNIGESGGGTWGSITGTLSAQTDLQEALNTKANTGDIPTALSELTADETHRTVTDTEKTTWNDKDKTFMTIAVSDEATAITAGTAKVTFRAPFAMTLYQTPRASLNTASSSGNPAIDINVDGTSIFSTTLTIDATEKTSTTSETAAVLSTTSIADDAEITIDIDTAGTGAKGLKVIIYFRRT